MNIQRQIEAILRTALVPELLVVENESASHHVPPGSETHFKVTLISAQFAGVPRIQRHRRVNQLLAAQLAGPVHALALHLHTPIEWQQHPAAPASPQCLGGGKPGH